MDSFKSDTVTIQCDIETVFAKLSNPESLKAIEKLPDDAKAKISKVSFDKDSISINANPVGEIKMQIVERVEPSRIVFEAAQSPVPFRSVITLERVDDVTTSATASLDVELNPFIRGMVAKPLQDGAKKFGELLANIPYKAL
jgi:hypothetical protein